jgi:hypothetical protein
MDCARLSKDSTKRVYATMTMAVGSRSFQNEEIAEIDGHVLYILAFKLIYYHRPRVRKIYVVCLDLESNHVYSVIGGSWLTRAHIRPPNAAEIEMSEVIPDSSQCSVLHLPDSQKHEHKHKQTSEHGQAS